MTLLFKILPKLANGFRLIRDLQTNETYETYDVLIFTIEHEKEKLGNLRIEVLKDGKINFFSDEFKIIPSKIGIPLHYKMITTKHDKTN